MESAKLFDPLTTALIWIDLQNGIVSIPILAPYSGKAVVQKAAELSAVFRSAGAFVVYVHVDMANTLHLPVDRQMRDPSAPPPPPGASELVADCGYHAGDGLVLKRQWGAFLGTDLDQLLRRRGIRTIVLGGIATNIGVESTARSAVDLGYGVIFISDAMTTVSAEMQAFALEKLFPMMGRVRTTTQISAQIAAPITTQMTGELSVEAGQR